MGAKTPRHSSEAARLPPLRTCPHPQPSHKSLHEQTAPAGGQTQAEFSPVNRTPLCNEVGQLLWKCEPRVLENIWIQFRLGRAFSSRT